MSVSKGKPTKSRTALPIADANRRRLARQRYFDAFLKKVRAIQRVKISLSSEGMVRQLRETGEIVVPQDGKTILPEQ